MKKQGYFLHGLGLTISLFYLTACSTTAVQLIPIETREVASFTPLRTAKIDEIELLLPVPAGFYRVQSGDTLLRISQAHKKSMQDLIAWNQLSNPNDIQINQLIRVAAPKTQAVARAQVAPVETAPVKERATPLKPAKEATAPPASATEKKPEAASTPAPAPAPAPAETAAPAPQQKPVENKESSSALQGAPTLIWPAKGPILSRFDGEKSKGIAIAGKAGDPVLAAADGSVVYVGSGLRGYGQFLIVKHDDTYLTVYAHNQKIRVRQNQEVKAGQHIADMGDTDADQVKLHFEVRRMGKPIDPLLLLPSAP